MASRFCAPARSEIEGIAALFQDFSNTAGHEVLVAPEKTKLFGVGLPPRNVRMNQRLLSLMGNHTTNINKIILIRD